MNGFNTLAVHSGELRDPKYGNITTPIFLNATFLTPNDTPNVYIDRITGKPFLYTRNGNPTVQALEVKYALLEGTKYGLTFSSGMSAITTSLLSILKSGDKVLTIYELYGQTLNFFLNVLPNYGIKVDFLTVDTLNRLEVPMEDFKLIYVESITNPTLKVADLDAIGKYAKDSNKLLFVDATFASPYNQRPLEFNANVVIHSGTKYLVGHNDVTIGFAGFKEEELFKTIAEKRKILGGIVDPLQAYLALRSIKSLGIRVETQNKNAKGIAEYLETNSKVKEVYYPGLSSSPYYSISKKVLKGFGGVVSFKVRGEECAVRILKSVKIIQPAPSLGGIESLITRPIDTSHSSIPEEIRRQLGLTPDLLRLSVGIEDLEDLIEDLGNALAQCT